MLNYIHSNTASNLEVISLPDNSTEEESPVTPQKPDEHVPPIEVPGRTDVPGHIPEKGAFERFNYPVFVKQ